MVCRRELDASDAERQPFILSPPAGQDWQALVDPENCRNTEVEGPRWRLAVSVQQLVTTGGQYFCQRRGLSGAFRSVGSTDPPMQMRGSPSMKICSWTRSGASLPATKTGSPASG